MVSLTAWAPRGNSELLAVCDGAASIVDLDEEHVAGLAAGLARGLRTYRGLKFSTFNFALYGAPVGSEDGSFRVHASLVSRQSVVEHYRCDDYFLQKMLGSEIVIDTPEEIAALARDAGV